jgi:hypothetical protein
MKLWKVHCSIPVDYLRRNEGKPKDDESVEGANNHTGERSESSPLAPGSTEGDTTVPKSKFDIGSAEIGLSVNGSVMPPPLHEVTNVYTVVGECYVHGIMDGWFMGHIDRLRMFELR